jgi:hypothetical protein
VGKNYSTFKKTLFTLGCDLSPNSLLKEIFGIEKKYNNTSFVNTSMHAKKKYRHG